MDEQNARRSFMGVIVSYDEFQRLKSTFENLKDEISADNNTCVAPLSSLAADLKEIERIYVPRNSANIGEEPSYKRVDNPQSKPTTPSLDQEIRATDEEFESEVNGNNASNAINQNKPQLQIDEEGDSQVDEQQEQEREISHTAGPYLNAIADACFRTGSVRLLSILTPPDEDLPIMENTIRDDKGNVIAKNVYYVAIRRSGPHLGSTHRMLAGQNDQSEKTFPSEKEAFEAIVLQMKTKAISKSSAKRRRSSLSRLQTPDQPDAIELPNYIFELGELRITTYDHHDGTSEDRSTYCHVVVDIASAEKALWLVYRYKGVENGDMITRKRKFDRDEDMFSFVESERGFDIAQIAISFQDWIDKAGNPRLIHNAEGLIKTTCRRADPECSHVVYESFYASLKQGD
ncbi:uncharacterized protein JN550_005649 [Neoarthrinium moseri]|uniref:uncharacterized protein n=1 Tax=Neoarthrinium moseri TaxID=1658444 RepID=UPI001FDCB59D|nr:uncharacterized protein JN550_005649 [Neoarthrinium moseri]KAI1869668.1 hypothetical protein JN550_005649 [Neoarthrinium moseri]